MIKNILLDRDGTIIEERHYLHDPKQVILLPGAAQTLQEMQAAGLQLFLVTNQSGIGRGLFTLQDFQAVQAKLHQLLVPYEVKFQGEAFCPHAPTAGCNCRKPAPGMWLDLAAKFALRPEESLMIGDKLVDIWFARNASLAKTIFLLTGHGIAQAKEYGLPVPRNQSWLELSQAKRTVHQHRGPDLIAKDLRAAWQWLQSQKLIFHPTNNR